VLIGRQFGAVRMDARPLFSKGRLLSFALFIDALLSAGFGLVSYFFPQSTYATIIDLSSIAEDSLMSAILNSLSIFYVVIGAVCFFSAFMPSPHDVRVAAAMIVQHAWIGIRGVSQMDREWIVGDPWPDIVIHSLFVVVYVLGITWRLQLGRQSRSPQL
jgi:hypothetical protein